MNIKSFFSLLFLFILLSFLQYSFLPRGGINLILIFICLLSFFKISNLLGPITGGFLIDIFSGYFLGFSIIVFLIISFIFKKSHKFLKDSEEKFPFYYFLPLSILSFLFYNSLTAPSIFLGLGYNIIIITILFYLFKCFLKRKNTK